jgi:hypothetical protein
MKRAAAEIIALATGLTLLALAIFSVPADETARSSFRATASGNYHVLSDASPDEVRHLIETLTDLHAQFRQEFASLLDPGRSPGKIPVLFFNREADYRDYVRRVAPALAGSDGCYLSAENRLAILNQSGRAEFARARQQLDHRQDRLARWADADAPQRLQAAARLRQWREAVAGEARASTDRLIRHEGAHQLFHAYGIESRFPVEPTWLTEGLAQYCEPAQLGAIHEPLVQSLRRARDAGTLIPLTTLLNHRDPAGFFAFDENRRELAYAESWALVWFLMQHHRQGVGDFIEHYRNIETSSAADAELKREPGQRLAEFLGVGRETLEAQWQALVAGL